MNCDHSLYQMIDNEIIAATGQGYAHNSWIHDFFEVEDCTVDLSLSESSSL